jgi:hypothetical protein
LKSPTAIESGDGPTPNSPTRARDPAAACLAGAAARRSATSPTAASLRDRATKAAVYGARWRGAFGPRVMGTSLRSLAPARVLCSGRQSAHDDRPTDLMPSAAEGSSRIDSAVLVDPRSPRLLRPGRPPLTR